MLARMKAEVFSVESGESKNGEWNNVMLFDKKNRKTIELFTRKTAELKDIPLDVPVTVLVDVSSNKFGVQLEYIGFEK